MMDWKTLLQTRHITSNTHSLPGGVEELVSLVGLVEFYLKKIWCHTTSTKYQCMRINMIHINMGGVSHVTFSCFLFTFQQVKRQKLTECWFVREGKTASVHTPVYILAKTP